MNLFFFIVFVLLGFGTGLASLFWGVVIMLVCDVFYHPLSILQKQDLTLQISGSGFSFMDGYVLGFLLAFGRFMAGSSLDWVKLRGPLIATSLLVLILSVPIAVGLSFPNNILTILRDCRQPLYYFLLIPVSFAMCREERFYSLLKIVGIASFIGLFWYYVARVLGISYVLGESTGMIPLSTGNYAKSFGFYSTYPFFALFFYLAGIKSFTTIRVGWLWGILSVIFLFPLILGLSRGEYLGLIGGTCILSMGLIKDRHIIYFKRFLFSFSLLIGIIGLTGIGFLTGPQEWRNVPVVERLMSTFDPAISTKAAKETAEFRKRAITYYKFVRNYNPYWGNGYGDDTRGPAVRDKERTIYLGHSALGWSLFRLGFPLTFLFYGILVWIIVKTLNNLNQLKNPTRGYVLAINAFAVHWLIRSVTGTNLFSDIPGLVTTTFIFGSLFGAQWIENDASQNIAEKQTSDMLLTNNNKLENRSWFSAIKPDTPLA